MREYHFCTISTGNYLPYCLALLESLKSQQEKSFLHVLISDVETIGRVNLPPQLKVYYTSTVCGDGLGKAIKEKYCNDFHDKFRWSLKSVFLDFLIDDFEKVIYIDNDIHFFNDFVFLFNELDSSDYILSPHFRSSNPRIDSANFYIQNTDGLFNGGFLAVNRGAKDGLKWWANTCLSLCEKDVFRGLFDDQSHLNMLPIFFKKVHILQHKGCNIANWNRLECKRIKTEGKVLINNEFPVVFIHFTRSTISGILKGEDSLLLSHLNLYKDRLEKHGVKNFMSGYTKNSIPKKSSLLKRIKSRISIKK